MPEYIKPGVKTKTDHISSRLLLDISKLGKITDIKYREMDSAQGSEIGIAGECGVAFFNTMGQIKKELYFNLPEEECGTTSTIILDVDGNGLYEFLRYNKFRFANISLLDHNGKLIWERNYRPKKVAFGDLNADGKIEIVVSDPLVRNQDDTEFNNYFNSRGGFEILNLNGKPLYSKPQSKIIKGISVIDSINNGGSQIIAGIGEDFVFWTLKDGILSKQKSKFNEMFTEFLIVKFPFRNSSQHLLTYHNNDSLSPYPGEYILYDLFSFRKITTFTTNYLDNIKATSIQFNTNKASYFAIFGSLLYQAGQWFGLAAVHSELYIFNGHGDLVYQQVYPGQGGPIITIPSIINSDSEALLVSVDSKVWIYELSVTVPPENSIRPGKPQK